MFHSNVFISVSHCSIIIFRSVSHSDHGGSTEQRSFWHLPMLLVLGTAATLLKFVGRSVLAFAGWYLHLERAKIMTRSSRKITQSLQNRHAKQLKDVESSMPDCPFMSLLHPLATFASSILEVIQLSLVSVQSVFHEAVAALTTRRWSEMTPSFQHAMAKGHQLRHERPADTKAAAVSVS